MKKLVMTCVLLGLPLLAQADYGQGGMGQGMGQGMGGQGMGMGQGGGQRPPGPPPEFFTACQGKKEGDGVTVTTPRGQLQGSCRLMFAPSGGGQQGQQGMGQRGMGQGGMGQRPQ